MRKLTTSTFCSILLAMSALTLSAPAQVLLDGGALELEGLVGVGANTSYYVVDFGGTPVSANTPRDSYAFGYQWDDVNTTAADGLLDVVNASGLLVDTTDFGGSLGLGINAFTVGSDTDTPDFGADSRFWTTFVGALSNGVVDWSVSDFGISSIVLEDGGFVGFRAQTFGAPGVPAIPVTAVPEPSALMLLGLGSLVGVVRRRRSV